MTTITLAAPAAATSSTRRGVAARHTENHIEGRFRPISAAQLATAAWLYSTGRITRRQLRVYFAAHEMAEQRRYAKRQTAKERPVFLIEQIAQLTGGRGSATALRDLRADVRALNAVGLVTVGSHAIQFAKNTDTLSVGEGGGDELNTFLSLLPSLRRTVPVPRRLVRALAAGFGRAETLYVIAFLLRAVFWRKREAVFTVDGRMKLSWVSEIFGLSRRSVTAARSHLIEIGWLAPLEVHQMTANLYGVHDVVNVHWAPGTDKAIEESTEAPTDLPTDSVDNPAAVGEGSGAASGGSASPSPDFSGGSASPRNKKTPSTKELNTRKLGVATPGPALVGSREKKILEGRARGAPKLFDVQRGDLLDTGRLFQLYAQALERGLAKGGDAGRLDFLSMANRAALRGHNPGGLLIWLLQNRKTEFITLSDEDAAAQRMREHFDGPVVRSSTKDAARDQRELTADEHMVEKCLRAAQARNLPDAFAIMRRGAQWTRERWDGALCSYRAKQTQQWMSADELGEW